MAIDYGGIGMSASSTAYQYEFKRFSPAFGYISPQNSLASSLMFYLQCLFLFDIGFKAAGITPKLRFTYRNIWGS
jgi:hypothetical protein